MDVTRLVTQKCERVQQETDMMETSEFSIHRLSIVHRNVIDAKLATNAHVYICAMRSPARVEGHILT